MLYDWFRNIHFAHPLFFALFALMPLLIYWYVNPPFRLQGTMIVSGIKSFGSGKSWKTILRHSLFVFRILAISAIVLALARPQVGSEQQVTTGEGIDIVLCLDISGSMLAQDFTPNRMEAAKQVAGEFIDRRPTDRIGLVIFAGESFTMCPLTTDHAVLKINCTMYKAAYLKMARPLAPGWLPG